MNAARIAIKMLPAIHRHSHAVSRCAIGGPKMSVAIWSNSPPSFPVLAQHLPSYPNASHYASHYDTPNSHLGRDDNLVRRKRDRSRQRFACQLWVGASRSVPSSTLPWRRFFMQVSINQQNKPSSHLCMINWWSLPTATMETPMPWSTNRQIVRCK